MKIKFRNISLNKANKLKLDLINSIIKEYQKDGYTLTLRQLYYQLVTRDIIPNIQSEYAKLSKLLKEGRMAGVVDWDAIEDRLRKPSVPSSWNSPKSILQSALYSYARPRQKGQNNYLEVWVEKDALSGVLKRVTELYHVPILVNRGYSSVSAMYDSYERFLRAFKENQKIRILYLGDYDPSGIDMIRDIRDRIKEFFSSEDFIHELFEKLDYQEQLNINDEVQKELDFTQYEFDSDIRDYINDESEKRYFEKWFSENFIVEPIALTIEQIRQYNPPPNPAKKTDPRAKDFIKKFGATSWEVDALPPNILNEILDRKIKDNIDFDIYKSVVDLEEADKDKIRSIINDFE
jgi:hypothetical protein